MYRAKDPIDADCSRAFVKCVLFFYYYHKMHFYTARQLRSESNTPRLPAVYDIRIRRLYKIMFRARQLFMISYIVSVGRDTWITGSYACGCQSF